MSRKPAGSTRGECPDRWAQRQIISASSVRGSWRPSPTCFIRTLASIRSTTHYAQSRAARDTRARTVPQPRWSAGRVHNYQQYRNFRTLFTDRHPKPICIRDELQLILKTSIIGPRSHRGFHRSHFYQVPRSFLTRTESPGSVVQTSFLAQRAIGWSVLTEGPDRSGRLRVRRRRGSRSTLPAGKLRACRSMRCVQENARRAAGKQAAPSGLALREVGKGSI